MDPVPPRGLEWRAWPAPTLRRPMSGKRSSRALVEHGDRLYALALRVTRDPDLAADALQEAFATALERAADFRGESSLGTWLHRIVYNKAIDLLRRRGRESALPDEDGRPRPGRRPALPQPLLVPASRRDPPGRGGAWPRSSARSRS